MSTVHQYWDEPPGIPFLPTGLDGPHWFAIRTRARHEKKVTAQLCEKRANAFLPLVTEVHRWSDRRKAVQVPVFPGYVFIHMVPTAALRLAVLQVMGVVGFVGIKGEGVPIPAKQIEDIRTMIATNVSCAPHPYLRAGQRVRIRGGSLDGIQGILVAQENGRSLVLSVELLQRSVAIRIDGYDVEAI